MPYKAGAVIPILQGIKLRHRLENVSRVTLQSQDLIPHLNSALNDATLPLGEGIDKEKNVHVFCIYVCI